MPVGATNVEEKGIGNAVPSRSAFEIGKVAGGGHQIAQMNDLQRRRHPISQMVQARPAGIGEGEVVHIAFAVHPGRRDVTRRPILLGILGKPEVQRGI